ncbi:MAG: hypothetical protein JRE21_07825 [Deltaproteobacteria bacterium]|nr:hypothetical protein [Deltaproteobacteria bacterium]
MPRICHPVDPANCLIAQQVDVGRAKGKKQPVRIYEVLGEKGVLRYTFQEVFARRFSLYREQVYFLGGRG